MMTTLKNEPLSSARYKGVRLSILRLLSGSKTVKAFCEYEGTNLNAKTFFDWEAGRNNGLSQVGAHKVVQRASMFDLQCSFEWLFYGLGAWPSYKVDTTDGIASQCASDLAAELAWYEKRYPQAAHVIVFDGAMAPEYRMGDMVIGLPVKDKQSAVGKTCLIQQMDGLWLLRHVEAGGKPDTFTLRCTHPDFQGDTQYDVPLANVALECVRRRLLA